MIRVFDSIPVGSEVVVIRVPKGAACLAGVLLGFGGAAVANTVSRPAGDSTDTLVVTGQRVRDVAAAKDSVPLLETSQGAA